MYATVQQKAALVLSALARAQHRNESVLRRFSVKFVPSLVPLADFTRPIFLSFACSIVAHLCVCCHVFELFLVVFGAVFHHSSTVLSLSCSPSAVARDLVGCVHPALCAARVSVRRGIGHVAFGSIRSRGPPENHLRYSDIELVFHVLA